MTIFLDTSVLVAAARSTDERHAASFAVIRRCSPENAACAAHTLAELYANLTGMPAPNRFRASQAMTLLDGFRSKFQWVELTAGEVLDTARGIAGHHLMGGIIYDALLLQCARKVDAEIIYTWDTNDFRRVAPDLAGRIVTP